MRAIASRENRNDFPARTWGAMKCCTSSGMSLRRLRRGGTGTMTVLTR
jgi:hypothetical protein